MKILVLSRYHKLGASSRVRFFQFFDFFDESYKVEVQSLFDDEYILKIYRGESINLLRLIRYYLDRIKFLLGRGAYDVIWVEKELFPFVPFFFESLFLRKNKFIIDYDDATFHSYDQHSNKFVRALFGRKVDKLMKRSCLVTVGNEYLKVRAQQAGALRISKIPSVIDINRFEAFDVKSKRIDQLKRENDRRLVVGWIGNPGSQRLLTEVLDYLNASDIKSKIKLKLVGARKFDFKGIDIEFVPWREDTEVEEIYTFDVGIMPVQDEPFQRGKCGFKLIQYMACSKPVIASPIGVNKEIITQDYNGFLAENAADWINAIMTLIESPELCIEMGKRGRKLVEDNYSIQAILPKLKSLIENRC